MRHVVEVDQSIKIEDSGSTVLAFADGIAHAIKEDRGVPFCSLVAASSLAVGWELLPGPLSGQCRHDGTFTR